MECGTVVLRCVYGCVKWILLQLCLLLFKFFNLVAKFVHYIVGLCLSGLTRFLVWTCLDQRLRLVLTLLISAFLGIVTFGQNRFSRKLRDEGRLVQETEERNRAGRAAKLFVDKSEGRYHQLKKMTDMGSRMQKLWFQVTGSDGSLKILALAPVSANCPIKLEKNTIKTLNKLLHTLKHPLVHMTEEVQHLAEERLLVSVQPLVSRGSLKDLIYQVSPLSDWSEKYAKYSKHPLSLEMVGSYGRQILEAVLFLYSSLELSPLGHIQTGNIFVEGDRCLLGGYESRFLGYRTRLFSLCRSFEGVDCTEDIDIIMFGCVLFEMACGYELTQLVPGEHDYNAIKYPLLKVVLEFIFRRNKKGRFISTMEEILELEFFQAARLPSIEEVWPERTALTRDMRQLIAQVKKGKPRTQPLAQQVKGQRCAMQ